MSKQTNLGKLTEIDFLYLLSQPTRRKLLKILLEKPDSLYIKEIADAINSSQRNTSFHLMKMAQEGLLKGEYRSIDSEGGRPGKFYEIEPKVKSKVKKIIELEV